jgi:hypothetical protein
VLSEPLGYPEFVEELLDDPPVKVLEVGVEPFKLTG